MITDTTPLLDVTAASAKVTGFSNVLLNDQKSENQGQVWDNGTNHVYFGQIANASQVLYHRDADLPLVYAAAGPDWAHADNATSGNVCLTQLNSSGAITGAMYLLGFGHCEALGYEEGSTPHIWVDCQARAYPSSMAAPTNSFGSALARFPFTNGLLLTSSDSVHIGTAWAAGTNKVMSVFNPIPGATHYSVSIDNTGTQILYVRYTDESGNGPFYQAWKLSDAINNTWTAPLLASPLPEPPIATSAMGGRHQSFCGRGRYIYIVWDNNMVGHSSYVANMLSANLNGSGDSVNPNGSGGYITNDVIGADASVMNREIESCAIRIVSGTPHLQFTIANDNATPLKQFNLWQK